MAKTPAERQRDSRQRKRDIVTDENGTCHDEDVTKSHPADVTPEGEILLKELFGSPRTEVATEPPLPGGPGTVHYLRAMSDLDLQLKIKSYPGTDWVNSPEHKEVLRRRQAVQAENKE